MSRLDLTVHADGVAVVTLAHPPVNALDAPLLEELAGLFEGLAAEAAVRAAVITGQGRCFSAGLDLKRVPELDRLGQRRLVDALNECFGTLYAWPKPLVAAVNGHAVAGGLMLALCADWRVVADVPLQASLAEVKVGVTYPVAPLEIARAELEPTTARRMILLTETLDAREAHALRVFDEHAPPEALMTHALVRARHDAELPPNAFAITKRELRAAALARIAEARAGRGEPRLVTWLGDEMRRAAAAVLRRAA
jgi:enoyl-CoA hydratase